MAPVVLEGLLGTMTRGTPSERIAGLTRLVTGHLDGGAAAVTCSDGTRHQVLASSGYEPSTLDYLLTDFVREDPGMQAVQRDPRSIFTWNDIPDYRNGHTVRSVLAPAGFDEGTTVTLNNAEGMVVGALHISIGQDTLPPWLKTVVSEVRPMVGDTVAQIRGQMDVSLSSREAEVLSLMAQGKSNMEIATDLFISRSTVNSHVEHILVKLTATNRVTAVVRALKLGLL